VIKEERFVFSHKPFAVRPDTFTVNRRDGGWNDAAVDAVWYRRSGGVLRACRGFLHSPVGQTPPVSLEEFLAGYTDGRWGGHTTARVDDAMRWWGPGRHVGQMQADYRLLKPMIDRYPYMPDGYDGWWTFRGCEG
jgi:hypothetical protein